MLKRALICIALITSGTVVALNAKAPADVGPKFQPAVLPLPSVAGLPEAHDIDYSFVFIQDELEGAR